MTHTQAILLPLFLHVLFILVLVGYVGYGRTAAVRGRRVSMGDIALDNRAWPDALRKPANNYDNQFQQPMLWYAATALQIATGLVDGVAVALAWLYLLARLAHSYVHLGTNYVPHRFFAFLGSVAILAAMWLWFALRLYVVG